MIVVDDRWLGRHGIARFSSEVLPRLHGASMLRARPKSPTSPLDVLSPTRLRFRRDDVLYSPGFNAGVTRARQVLTLHDLIHLDEPAERSKSKTLYYDLVVRPAVRRAGVVLTVSGTSQARIRDWLGEDSRVDVIDVGNGCSEVFLQRAAIAPSGAGRFLYVGNLKPHKNVEVLFKALAMRPDYRLTLLTGDGDRSEELAVLHGVTDRVQVRHGLDDDALAALYQEHDALLMPSRLEGFGLPALEALAVGRRVGYSSVCASVDEIVGAEGVAVRAALDAGEWASAMDHLLAAGPSRIADASEWQARYRWDGVAQRVGDALGLSSA